MAHGNWRNNLERETNLVRRNAMQKVIEFGSDSRFAAMNSKIRREAMRFLSIYTPDQKTAAAPPSKEHMAQMAELIEETMKAGTLLATGALLPAANAGARIRRAGGKTSIIDGAFSETKEVIAGFAMLEAKSKEDAIEMTRRFLAIAGDGDVELRQIMEQEADFGCE